MKHPREWDWPQIIIIGFVIFLGVGVCGIYPFIYDWLTGK